MTKSSLIDVAIEGAIAIVTVSGLQRLSTHDLAFGRALGCTLRAFDDRDDIKAIVLTSSDANFCIEAPHEKPTGQAWMGVYAAANGLYQSWCFSRKITIAAVNGRCAGAGVQIMLCADLAVAADDAVFFSPFGDLAEASVVLCSLTIGLNRTKAWIVAEDPLDAAAALSCGLVNRVVRPAVLVDAALTLARACCKMPLDGIAMSKVMVESYLDGQGVGTEFDHTSFHAAAMPA